MPDASDLPTPSLRRRDLALDPFEQFRRWYDEWQARKPAEPTAMTLATASKGGEPSARIVLLKDYGPEGFVFFTHYRSPKGRELRENNRAALLFFWPELSRQVRISGAVTEVSRGESEEYFRNRPRLSRLGAWASHQSAVLANREELEQRVAEFDRRFPGEDVPLPDYWGGYRLRPVMFEFWQARQNRLHDRFRFSRGEEGLWKIERLSP